MPCSLRHENRLRALGHTRIAGIDEAGRGPLAGPVVVAAVILPLKFRHRVLNDSKQLNEKQREALYEEISTRSDVAWSVVSIDPPEIDRLNILRATHEGMRQAAARLEPDHALIDGLPVTPFPYSHTALVEGDSLSFSIAAASIIAKVTRDRIMHEWHELHPVYEFRQNKGYPTPRHLAILREHGPCSIHRRSFAPVAQCWLDFGTSSSSSTRQPG
ncbi:MAG TPA: ribonuclease HII [Chthoniobacterales bacterium]|jgi:ribonuclease HII